MRDEKNDDEINRAYEIYMMGVERKRQAKVDARDAKINSILN